MEPPRCRRALGVWLDRGKERTLPRHVQDPLALQILSGEFKEGDTVDVEADHEGLYFEKEKVAA
jgi:ATP-dependent Clp protease ATP-binding subunit ClpA